MSNKNTKSVEEMTPVEVIQAVRAKDIKTIKVLAKILIDTSAFTINGLQRTLEDYGVKVNATTIGRWIK